MFLTKILTYCAFTYIFFSGNILWTFWWGDFGPPRSEQTSAVMVKIQCMLVDLYRLRCFIVLNFLCICPSVGHFLTDKCWPTYSSWGLNIVKTMKVRVSKCREPLLYLFFLPVTNSPVTAEPGTPSSHSNSSAHLLRSSTFPVIVSVVSTQASSATPPPDCL